MKNSTKTQQKDHGALVIFVKTPGLSPLKTRLAASVGAERALKFYEASLVATAALANQLACEVVGLQVYWAVAEQEAQSLKLWRQFPTVWQGEGSLGERLSHVYDEMLKRYEYVCFMGADSPHVQVRELVSGVSCVRENFNKKFIFGPTTDGGFYFFGSGVVLPKSVWTGVAYSASSTLSELSTALQPFGSSHFIETNFDIDTLEDLKLYKNLNIEDLQLLPEQRRLIQDGQGGGVYGS